MTSNCLSKLKSQNKCCVDGRRSHDLAHCVIVTAITECVKQVEDQSQRTYILFKLKTNFQLTTKLDILHEGTKHIKTLVYF